MADTNENGLSRRHFLAAAGLAGGALAAGGTKLFAEQAPASQPGTYAKKKFGRTGIPVTIVGFGAIRISPPTGSRLLKMAIDSGMNVLHSARGYQRGRSFEAIGQLFKAEPDYRKKVMLCLKENTEVSEERLDQDLAALNTDHADIYLPQLQEPDQSKMEDAIAALDKLKDKGKIRFGGFTCHSKINEVIELVVAKAPKAYDGCLITTAPLRPEDGRPAQDDEAKRFARNLRALSGAGVGVISMKSGASKVVGQDAAEYGAHMRVLAEAGVDTCITSFASFKEIENAVAANLDRLGPATAGDYARWQHQWAALGWPCLMCGQCTGACPAGLPVGDLMRLGMYRDHYRMTPHARQEFAELRINAATAMSACDGCTSCTGACPMGLAGSGRVRNLVSSLA